MNNPYEVLGVYETSSMEEITKAYNKQKEELREMLLSEGEEGMRAAEKLQKIKDAFSEISYLKGSNPTIDGDDKRPYGRIEELIKENKLYEAQQILDAQAKRGAEWHYMQAALYYKQGWIMESKKQLELARSMSNDEKYAKAYKRIVNIMNFGNPNGPTFQGAGPERSYPNNPPQTADSGLNCCNICGALLCADCCCDCLGGGC